MPPRRSGNPTAETIRAWLAQQAFHVSNDDTGTLERVTAYHVNAKKQQSGVVYQATFKSEAIDPDSLATLAEEMVSELENDATVLGTQQVYELLPYFRKSGKGARKVVRIDGTHGGESRDLSSEAPTNEGVLSMAMRHAEFGFRQAALNGTQIHDRLVNRIDKLEEALDRALTARLDYAARVEAMMSKQHEREMAAREMKMREERWAEVTQSFLPLIPGLVNFLTGRKITTAASDPVVKQAILLYRSLSEEQGIKFLDIFNEKQKMAFLQLVDMANKGDAADRKQIDGMTKGEIITLRDKQQKGQ